MKKSRYIMIFLFPISNKMESIHDSFLLHVDDVNGNDVRFGTMNVLERAYCYLHDDDIFTSWEHCRI